MEAATHDPVSIYEMFYRALALNEFLGTTYATRSELEM
jgi:hypothetical protein